MDDTQYYNMAAAAVAEEHNMDAEIMQQQEEVVAGAGGRSSSSSHFDKDYETASVGVAEHVFYGIELSNDVVSLETNGFWPILGLVVILVLLFLQTLQSKRRSNNPSAIVVAAIIGGICAGAPSTTWIPLFLTTIIYTRTAYPYMVVVPHCIVACATYRRLHTTHASSSSSSAAAVNNNNNKLQSLVCSFFLYGFGGSIVSDVLMGLPATALSHPRIIPCHVVGWILVNFSPRDWLYRNTTNSSNKSSLFMYLLTAMEAIDAVTTPMGRVSRSARELRNKTTAPIVAGLLSGVGGGTLRFLAGEPQHSHSSSLETAFYKTLSYSTLWWYLAVYRCDYGFFGYDDDQDNKDELEEWNHCGSYNGSDLTRVILVGAHVAWTLLVEMGMARGHPLVWLCRRLTMGGTNLSHVMGWGPTATG